jgi:ACS family tartrate transporter-like MFS transporter
VQGMGFTNVGTGFVVALPYLAAVVAMILWGRSSDRHDERIWHVAGPVLVAASGLIVASFSHSDFLLFVALSSAIICIETIQGPFWSMPSTFLGGTAAAAGIGLIAATGQFGAFLGTAIMGVLRQGTGDYAAGLFVLASGLLLSAAILLILGRTLALRPIPVAAVAGRDR